MNSKDQTTNTNKRSSIIFDTGVLLGVIIVLGLLLRIYNLETESYWIDEIATVFEARQSVTDLINSGRLDQPIGYYLPFRIWMQGFGQSEAGTRSFSVLAGIGSIFLTFLIGKKMFDDKVGLVSAFIMSISVFQIHYSQETRNYMFFEFTVLLSVYFYVLALERNKIQHWIIYLLSTVLMIYSNIFGILILGTQGLWFLLYYKEHKEIFRVWLISQILILTIIVPFHIPLLSGNGKIQGAVELNIPGLPSPSIGDLVRTFYRFVLPPREDRSWNVILINYAIAGIILVIGIWLFNYKNRVSQFFVALSTEWNLIRKKPNFYRNLLFAICWLTIPIIVPFIYSIVGSSLYKDNYMIGAAPALFLILAVVIFIFRRVIPILLSLGFLVIMVVPGLNYYYISDVKDQWREIAQQVTDNSKQNELVVFAPNWGNIIQQRSFDWYYEGDFRACSLGDENGFVEPANIPEDINQCVMGYDRFWVIVSDQIEDNDHFITYFQNHDSKNFRKIIEQDYVGEISLFLFEAINSE